MKERLTSHILGAGLVGPFGSSVEDTWMHYQRGESPPRHDLAGRDGWPGVSFYEVPPETAAEASRLPRLRRSSPISLYAVTAARLALANAGWTAADFAERRSILLFAASDGSVIYTRRFFEGVEKGGPGAGSPLLFPETVYNAPASHVAADLGFGGLSLSLVGDAAAGLEACHQAARFLHSGEAEAVLVVAAEEVDAVACAGYAAWGLARSAANDTRVPGCIFSGGAGAVLLSLDKEDSHTQLATTSGSCFRHIKSGCRQLQSGLELWQEQSGEIEAIFPSDSGTWMGERELQVLAGSCPNAVQHAIKRILGEGLSAATLWQVVLARHSLPIIATQNALVTSLGFNGQIATALLSRS
jgi:3-oxoacyl-[acyl-carrier-protein] synthase III